MLRKIVGVFTAKAINTPINKNTCVIYFIFDFDKKSKSVLPKVDDITKIDNNKNNEPNKVYKNK
jgi:hypothetical protein